MEQDLDGGQEVNRRQRRVGDEYVMGGISLQTLLLPPDLVAASRELWKRPKALEVVSEVMEEVEESGGSTKLWRRQEAL